MAQSKTNFHFFEKPHSATKPWEYWVCDINNKFPFQIKKKGKGFSIQNLDVIKYAPFALNYLLYYSQCSEYMQYKFYIIRPDNASHNPNHLFK